ncbi:MAG: class I mannose-6-phosphate isomerase [Phycisphaerales bacterium]|nr:class I mannose-6-phosphate isomerase [Phycisphaerales bacterium]
MNPQATSSSARSGDLPGALTFEPILVPKVWGGRKLAEWGKHLPESEPIGESWELADLPDGGPSSIVDQGPCKGMSLRHLVESHEQALMGACSLNAQQRFPLLIKFLDARENLSVQVHPDDAWVARHEGDHLKSEAWLVLDADAGSLIHAGLQPGTSAQALTAAVTDGSIVDLLRSVPARVGDCHTLVSGTCHALGAGVLVAEVQTTSDTTFRVYDWGRTDRAIHVEQALACIDPAAAPPLVEPTQALRDDTCEHLIAKTDQFTMARIDSAGGRWTRPDLNSPSVIMCVAGAAEIDGTPIARGRTALIPACAGSIEVHLSPGTSLVHAQPTTSA